MKNDVRICRIVSKERKREKMGKDEKVCPLVDERLCPVTTATSVAVFSFVGKCIVDIVGEIIDRPAIQCNVFAETQCKNVTSYGAGAH